MNGMNRLKEALAESAMTDEMLSWFEERTRRHIGLVQKWAREISVLPGLSVLAEVAKSHDASKFKEPERTPYVFVSWQYRCKDIGRSWEPPAGVREMMAEATLHHVLNNPHHPEFHSPVRTGLLNREDRDGVPAKMVDATRMPRICLAEMVSDWCAMSEEKGTNVRDWMKKMINVRWKFTGEQVNFMRGLVEGIGL